MTHSPGKRALLSVSDKSGIADFARRLVELGYSLLSTGGTAQVLREAGLPVEDVADCTGFPEMMEGRVKTLHPVVHGGILGRRSVDDAVMRQHEIAPIDLVCVNLYPFEETVASPDSPEHEVIENIDIGGPAMIRAAAKNHVEVAVVVDPGDYEELLKRIDNGCLDRDYRRQLALKAFRRTAAYDAAIAQYFGSDEVFPDRWTLSIRRRQVLRYGENPHQRAAYYSSSPDADAQPFRQLHGKELSYNNIADLSAAIRCVLEFEEPACAIVKHANPCGVAIGATVTDAYNGAYSSDPASAFGGIICFNRKLDGSVMNAIIDRQFSEVVMAPGVEPDALEAAQRRPNIRLLSFHGTRLEQERWSIASALGGYLVQESDQVRQDTRKFTVPTEKSPTDSEWHDLLFAWRVCGWVKSNAVVIARGSQTLGIGAGQMSRVISSRIAVMKAEETGFSLQGAALASDGFFPFRDGIDEAAQAGVTSVIQPGGSVRDREVVAAANEHGMAMVLTGERCFRH